MPLSNTVEASCPTFIPFPSNTMEWGKRWLLSPFRSKKNRPPVKLISTEGLKPNDIIDALQNLKYTKYIFDKWAEEFDSFLPHKPSALEAEMCDALSNLRGNSQKLADAVDNICNLRLNYTEAMVEMFTNAKHRDSGIIEVPESLIQIGQIIDESSASLGAQTGVMKELLDSIKDLAGRIEMARRKKEDSLWQKIKKWLQKLLNVLSTVLSACALVIAPCDPSGTIASAFTAGCTLSTTISSLVEELNQPSSGRKREKEKEEKLMTFLSETLPRDIRQTQLELNAGEKSLRTIKMLKVDSEVKIRTRVKLEDSDAMIKVWQSHGKALDSVKQVSAQSMIS